MCWLWSILVLPSYYYYYMYRVYFYPTIFLFYYSYLTNIITFIRLLSSLLYFCCTVSVLILLQLFPHKSYLTIFLFYYSDLTLMTNFILLYLYFTISVLQLLFFFSFLFLFWYIFILLFLSYYYLYFYSFFLSYYISVYCSYISINTTFIRLISILLYFCSTFSILLLLLLF